MTVREHLDRLTHYIALFVSGAEGRLKLIEDTGVSRLWVVDDGTYHRRIVGLTYLPDMDSVAVTDGRGGGAVFGYTEVEAVRETLHAVLAPKGQNDERA